MNARGIVSGFVLLAALGLAGCGGGAQKTGAASNGGDADRGKTFKIAMIAKSTSNTVFPPAHAGARDAAKKLSEGQDVKIEVEILTPQDEDGQVQAQRIAQAVNQGAQAVLISCSDAGKATGAIDDAVERGVQVMTFDSDAPRSKRFAYYGVDDLECGRQVMKELAAQMGGKGKVGILAGNQNAPNLQKRAEGVREEAGNHPGIEIVDSFYFNETPQDAAKKVISVMQAHPDLAGWAMIGGWALNSTALLDELDPQRVKVVSVDALPPMLLYVQKGLVPVLLAQPTYKWGYDSVGLIVDKCLHKKDVPAVNKMELVRVTKENLGAWAKQLKDWGFEVPAELLEAP
ncbi:MAG: substrate-binding domain-containing protein [Planctomycetota bacterium]|nr:substrate-binding domain-containing protein [Planctomycetota bacterium]